MNEYPRVYIDGETGVYWFVLTENMIWCIDEDTFYVSAMSEKDFDEDETITRIVELGR